MIDVKSQFDFLKDDFSELHKLAVTCDLLYQVDFDSCAAKLRLFAEFWLELYIEKLGHHISVNSTFGEKVTFCKAQGWLDQTLYDWIEIIRITGNRVAHVKRSHSQAATVVNLSKQEVLPSFKAAFDLAEVLYFKFGQYAEHNIYWHEPTQLQYTAMYLGAHNEDPNACFKVASYHIQRLKGLPTNKSRDNQITVNRAISTVEYWLEKANFLEHPEAAGEMLSLYHGHFHPTAHNKEKYLTLARQNLKSDTSGHAHFVCASIYLEKGNNAKALEYLEQAHALGSVQALKALLQIYRLQNVPRFLELVEQGIEKKTPECLLLGLMFFVVNQRSIPKLSKDAKRLYIQCLATSLPGMKYVKALAQLTNLTDEKSSVDENSKTLLREYTLIPEYCMPAFITVHTLFQYEMETLCTQELLQQALAEVSSTAHEGMFCFLLSEIVETVYNVKKVVLNIGYSPYQLLKRAAKLKHPPAVEAIKNTTVTSASPKRKLKVNRKAIKKRRKQKA